MRPLRGILLKLASVVVFITMSSVIKATADQVPAGANGVLPLAFRHAGHPDLAGVAARTCAPGCASPTLWAMSGAGWSAPWRWGCGFAGLGLSAAARGDGPRLCLAACWPWSSPRCFWAKQVRLFRISAVVLGLIGVLIVLSPRLTVLSGDGTGSPSRLWARCWC